MMKLNQVGTNNSNKLLNIMYPILFIFSKLFSMSTKNTEIKLKNIWDYDLKEVDVLTIFFVPTFMDKLEKKIINEMEEGVPASANHKVLSITNRLQAIKTACKIAKSGDIILVAGKGHEKYQEIKGVKHPFDDKQILREALEAS